MDELRAVTLFIRAAELGSFNKAAVAEGLSAQAISKAIRQLEHHLGIRLFHRTTRKNSLTEDGLRFLDSVKPNFEGLIRTLAAARTGSQEWSGLIRISASRTVGINVLLPLIAEFRGTYPNVEFELVLEDRVTDIVSNRIDIGFRTGHPPDGQIISRRLFPLLLVPCAAPAYLDIHGVPNCLQDLQNMHVCTGYRQTSTGKLMPWEFELNGEVRYVSIPAKFCTNDAGAEMEAVLAGFGAGLIDYLLAGPYFRSGALIPFLVEQISSRMGTYIYYPHRSEMPRRVRAFIDFAIEKLLNNPLYAPSVEVLNGFQLSYLAKRTRTPNM